jgi:hypothetical protein
MESIQLLRYVAILDERLKNLEKSLNNGVSSSSPKVENSVIPTDLTDVLSRLAAVEARPVVDLSDVSGRLAAVEARPVVDLTDVSERLAAVEVRPVVDLTDVSERLTAVEARPVVDLTDVSGRLAAVEARPELSQRLSALELTVTSLNSN